MLDSFFEGIKDIGNWKLAFDIKGYEFTLPYIRMVFGQPIALRVFNHDYMAGPFIEGSLKIEKNNSSYNVYFK